MTRISKIIATGSYLPERVVTNYDLETMVDTSHEWIVQRSGIEERRIAADNQATSDLAIKAAQQALAAAGISAAHIDGIVVATTTPDQTFPSVAAHVQAALGVPPCLALDVQAVCTGFVYALSVGDNFIRAGQAGRVLVIGAEKMSSILNWEDRTTCVLFGDGAGAVILEGAEGSPGQLEQRGIHSCHLYANGNQKDLLYTDGGPSTTGSAGHVVMKGREVFKYAVDYMAGVVQEALEKNNLEPDQIDWLVPHQANMRIIKSTADKLKMPMDKVILTVQKHGNTSAASIPLALDAAVRDGRIQKGDLLLLEAMGGGLTWGAALARF